MRKHATLLGAVLLAFVSALSYAQAPVPFINLPLMPDAAAPGGPQFTLTLNGTGFVSTSVVNWNGTALATQFVSQSQLTATVPAANIATASTGWVTVVNPAPGGGTSDTVYFTVRVDSGKRAGFGWATSPAADQPSQVAVGDFNDDGKLDLAISNSGNNTASVFLGDGTGNFTLASSIVVGSQPSGVAIGDFNGDGKLDLAVANGGDNTVSIFLGDGTGNFTLVSTPAVGNTPNFIVVADLNHDGKLDLATTNWNDGTLSILLGDGTGHFTLADSPVTGSGPGSGPNPMAVGDFNHDGNLDFAVPNFWDHTVTILVGDGTGQFTQGESLHIGTYVTSVATGDFNGDGNLDLVVTAPYGGVPIFLGDGAGGFSKFSNPWRSDRLWSTVVGDFNGDGNLDLAVTDSDAPGTVSILLGDGKGKFTLASSAGVGIYPAFVTLGDFTGNGKLGLVTANNGDTVVSVLLEGVAAVSVAPSSLNFGTQLVNTTSSPQPVTLTNTSGDTLHISKITASSNFSQTNNCPSQVPPNGQCTINVTFDPHGRFTQTGTLRIKDDAPNSPQTVSLTGVGTVVTLLPSSLNFGDQQVGTTSQPQVATLTNYGTQALSIEGYGIRITRQNAGAFAQTNNCGTSVTAGGSCNISVTFTPKTKGAKAATLAVGDNGGASPQTVALSGNGTE